MKNFASLALGCVLLLLATGCASTRSSPETPELRRATRRLEPIEDRAALLAELHRVAAWRRIVDDVAMKKWERKRAETWADSMPLPASPPAQGVEEMVITATVAAPPAFDSVSVTSFSASDLQAMGVEDVSDLSTFTPNLEIASITNNQEVGVDEGDIIKRHGDFLILLRRGRLFTFDVGGGPGAPIRKVDEIDVFPFDEPHDAWYDELLVSGETLVVLGYEGMTEIALFRIGPRGELTYTKTWFVKSNDYYSSSDYSTRLIGGELVFYLPIFADLENGDALWPEYIEIGPSGLPEEEPTLRPLVDQMDLHRSPQHTLYPILHAVIRCPVLRDTLECEATGIVGPGTSVRYVSRTAAYLWITSGGWAPDLWSMELPSFRGLVERGDYDAWTDEQTGMLYRIPFDGGRVGAVELRGHPVDSFSFREHKRKLQVLLAGDWWSDDESEAHRREWVEIPLRAFRSRATELDTTEYEPLPDAECWCPSNRFVGDFLLYGSCVKPGEPGFRGVVAKNLATDTRAREIALPYSPSRIERVGRDAVVIGDERSGGTMALHLTPLILESIAERGRTETLPLASEAESRSHGFNYTAWEGEWLMGLPMQSLDHIDPNFDPHRAPEALQTSISYFSLDDWGNLTARGQLDQSQEVVDDHCKTSCVDWYGSHRPIFMDHRVLALMDYELVEGDLTSGSIEEVQRVNALEP